MSRVEVASVSLNSTFRDPQGRLHQDGERVLREIYAEHAREVISWLQSPLTQKWIAERRLIPTAILDSSPDPSTWLEHERIFFPSYPWEWTVGQWKAAGALTLDLCEEGLESGLILKDATPLNVLFSGSSPIFVDLLSFERRDRANPIWIAYAQFVRTFLLPLAAYAYLGWPLSASQQRRDGYEPADLAPWLSPQRRWTAPLRSLVTVPLLLEKRVAHKPSRLSYRPKFSDELSERTLRNTLRKARKLLNSIVAPEYSSKWSHYVETASHYDSEDHEAKRNFVRTALAAMKPAHVLDVGANTGTYSRIAAECGAEVVAWDTDVRALDLNWRMASKDKLSILPLVADFARPTPAVGWRNQEYAGLSARAQQKFDCVLMLGILHHLLVSEQIPLPEILDQLAQISKRWAILEWIPQEDSQFKGLCRGREHLYKYLDQSYFERELTSLFLIRSRETLPNGRTLFHVERVG